MENKNDSTNYSSNEYSFISMDVLKGCLGTFVFIVFSISVILWIIYEIALQFIKYIS